ncbi:CPBP family intramembrane glutamic endopeptidase [Microbacterium sp. X-17]|uniref:CPBP family intramembrane glutamic endopeptidase n=1 Tax=Microbacterium sp. X-17 TaxID=3144404 RepID=UPI0031F5B00C
MSEPSDTETMPDSTDRRGAARARRRRSWRRGGSSVRRWNWGMVGWAVLALGVGVLAGAAAAQFIGGELGSLLSTLALWVAMVVPVVVALRISVPRGLLGFRPVDLLYAVAFGILLRLAQGWLQSAAGPLGFPSYITADGQLPTGWWFTDALAPILIGPAVEEFFFHGLVLVAIFVSVLRASRDRSVAGAAAVLLSTGLFLLAHAVVSPLPWYTAVALLLLAVTNGLLVVLTGRIWPAILTHVVYNGSFVVLALVGTFAR